MESMIRDGLSEKEQAAVDEEMAKHGPRVQAWPLHRSKVVVFIRHAEAVHNAAFKVRSRSSSISFLVGYSDFCWS